VGIGGHDRLNMDSDIFLAAWDFLQFRDLVDIPDYNFYHHGCLVGQGNSADCIYFLGES
jgi:hypothetical protein